MVHFPDLSLLSPNNSRTLPRNPLSVDGVEERAECAEAMESAATAREQKSPEERQAKQTERQRELDIIANSVAYQLYRAAEINRWTHNDVIPYLPGDHPKFSAKMPVASPDFSTRDWKKRLSNWRKKLHEWAAYIVCQFGEYKGHLDKRTRLSDEEFQKLNEQMNRVRFACTNHLRNAGAQEGECTFTACCTVE